MKQREDRGKAEASGSAVFVRDPGLSDLQFTVWNSFTWYWLSPHDLLGFCSCSFQPFFFFLFWTFLSLLIRSPTSSWHKRALIGNRCVAHYMDSPLSRSPGSRVLMGVGLPITRASSPLGGPHRLEYWGTPPHNRSLPLALLPPPPPPLLHWPIEWDWEFPPIRFWLLAGLACQLVVVAPSDWPCAKKRLTSSSPANSARMVVFPSTHLPAQKTSNY